MTLRWSKEEVAARIDWEGGEFEAIDWGLHDDVIEDDELREAWRDLSEAHQAMQPALKRVRDLLG